DHPRGDRRRGPAARTTRCALGVPGVARLWWVGEGELRRHGLAQDDRARGADALDRRRVVAEHALFPPWEARGGWKVARGINVLQSHGKPGHPEGAKSGN